MGMIGIFIIILLVASIVVLCSIFLMVALWMGKGFNQIGNQNPQPDQPRHRAESRH
jgi:flagellar basal body-associated protein FliL